MNRKIICIVLAVIMLISLAACGKEQADAEMSGSSGELQGETAGTTTTAAANVSDETTETSTTAATTTAATTTATAKATSAPIATTKTTTTTTIAPAKKSWFDEQGFKITPLTEGLCLNKGPEHECEVENKSGIIIEEGGDWSKQGDDEYCSITFYTNSRQCFETNKNDSANYRAIAFDRNTGVVFCYSADVFSEIVVNGEKYRVQFADGFGGGYYTNTVCCSADYEGTVFVIASDWIIHPQIDQDELHTIDEFIDFDTADYYFFSPSNS